MDSHFLFLSILVLLFKVSECSGSVNCEVYLNDSDWQQATQALNNFFANGSDIVEVYFDPGNVEFQVTRPNGTDYSMDDVKNKLGLFVFFYVTDQGKRILQYSASANSILTMHILESHKNYLTVPLRFEPASNCSFDFESLKRNVRESVALNLTATDENYICNYYINENSVIGNDFIFTPYNTWNTWITKCFYKNSSFELQPRFVCKFISVLTLVILLTFPLIVNIFPDPLDRDLDLYHEYDTPYSVKLLWKFILHGCSVSNDKIETINRPRGSFCSVCYFCVHKICVKCLNLFGPVCRQFIIISWIPFLFYAYYSNVLIQGNNQYNTQVFLANEAKESYGLVAQAFCVVHIFLFFLLIEYMFLQINIKKVKNKILILTLNCKKCLPLKIVGVSPLTSEEVLPLEDVELLPVEESPKNTVISFSHSPSTPKMYLMVIENSILSKTSWMDVFTKTLEHKQISPEQKPLLAETNGAVSSNMLDRNYSCPEGKNCNSFCYKLVQCCAFLIVLLARVTLFLFNAAFILCQVIPIVDVFLKCQRDLYDKHRKKSRTRTVIGRFLFYPTFIWCFPFAILFCMYSMISIQLLIQAFVLTCFVAAPIYPSYVYPRVAMWLVLVKLLMDAWQDFHKECHTTLEKTIEAVKDINPRPTCVPRTVFQTLYKAVGSTCKIKLFTKTFLYVSLFVIALDAGSSNVDDKNFLLLGQSVLLFFITEGIGKIFGSDEDALKSQIKQAIQTYVQDNKEILRVDLVNFWEKRVENETPLQTYKENSRALNGKIKRAIQTYVDKFIDTIRENFEDCFQERVNVQAYREIND